LINNRIVREINYPISLFDCIAVPSVKKYYKIILKGRKFEPISVPEKETKSKMYKVISKTYLSGKKLQLNLSQGRNVLLNEKEKAENIKSGDFVVMDNSKNNIIKIISIKKDVGVVIVKGKHFGIEGKVIDIIKEGENELAIIKTKDGEIKVNIDNIFAKD
jgi:small subunit ribosomal protein S4e